jgi:hypothetical protein
MSKQKNNKQENRISPERYIRERARNLSIYKCWVNNDWKSSQSATIFVTRKHASGNITYGIYIVDLLCLGVRRTLFKYNVIEEDLLKMIEGNSKLTFVEIPYNLAHNIIYASIEYAEGYGFSPNADFTRVTQYLLEEDDEEIPLIDIHCGDEKGQPFYINHSLDTVAHEKQIIAQLKKTAGQGNYRYAVSKGRNNNDDYADDDYDDDYADDDEFSANLKQLKDELRLLNDDELKACYYELHAKQDCDKHVEFFVELVAIVDVTMENVSDYEKVSNYFSNFLKIFDTEIIDLFDLPNSTLDLQYDDVEKLKSMHDEAIIELNFNDNDELFKEFCEEVGDVPYVHYMELSYNNLSNDEYDKKLNEYLEKYPDYLLFKINKYSDDVKLHEEFKTLLSKTKRPVTSVEFAEYIRCYAIYCLVLDDVNELIAFDYIVRYFKYKDLITNNMITYMSTIKIAWVRMYYEGKL